ncbi:hypothetical protein BV20DRAFT_131974 [Pilatotrama ljubarskyi]|nr:hypothetical protein BV20DRAFT_131974 [Pilatotrama ljubarskyi]
MSVACTRSLRNTKTRANAARKRGNERGCFGRASEGAEEAGKLTPGTSSECVSRNVGDTTTSGVRAYGYRRMLSGSTAGGRFLRGGGIIGALLYTCTVVGSKNA